MEKKHYNVVAAVICKDDLIFCCQRGPKGECAYKWEFPGGKIEPGETKEEAIIREIEEELNSKVKVEKELITVNHEYNTFSLTMTALKCSLVEGSLELSEHKNSRWVHKDELANFDFAEADKKIIASFK